MYGINPDIFELRPMDGCDMKMDPLTVDEILNLSQRKEDLSVDVNLNFGSPLAKSDDNVSFFELGEKEEGFFDVKFESPKVEVKLDSPMQNFNYVNNGFGLKRENLIGRQRFGMFGNNLMRNGMEIPNLKTNFESLKNNNLNQYFGQIDYTVPQRNLDELNDTENTEQINTKKRKSMNIPMVSSFDDKLPPSKTPIIDAIIYCALKGEGISIECRDTSKILFKVTDYEYFYEKQKQVCSKQNPTDDESSRIKTIQKWFKNFPTKKERSKTNQTIFYFSVEKSVSEDKFRKN